MTHEETNPTTDPSETPEVIHKRMEIDETRAEMGETLDAIQDRLSPQRLKEQAGDMVREQTVGRAEDMIEEASQRARGAGLNMIETIRHNPIPAAVAGFGFAWLFLKARSGGVARPAYAGSAGYGPDRGNGGSAVGQAVDRATGTMSDTADRAQAVAGDVAGRAQELGGQAQQKATSLFERAQETFEESPLAVGAAAVGLGVAIALMVPTHPKENELMGETRDRLVDRAQETAEDLQEKVGRVAESAKASAKQEMAGTS